MNQIEEFFATFVKMRDERGPRAQWDALGEVLRGTVKRLWAEMGQDSCRLPFHGDPGAFRGRRRQMPLGKGWKPADMIMRLLTDGRAIYRAQFAAETKSGARFAVACVDLPLKDATLLEEPSRSESQRDAGEFE